MTYIGRVPVDMSTDISVDTSVDMSTDILAEGVHKIHLIMETLAC